MSTFPGRFGELFFGGGGTSCFVLPCLLLTSSGKRSGQRFPLGFIKNGGLFGGGVWLVDILISALLDFFTLFHPVAVGFDPC